jgi:hypothetical protein
MPLALALRGHVSSVTELPRGLSSWLYVGEGAAARIELERSLAGLQRVSTAHPLQERAEALRRPYLDAIGALSVVNASPEWWASELAAKSPYTRLFERLSGLAVARDLIDSGLDHCLVVCATRALVSEVDSAAAARGIERLHIDSPLPVATVGIRSRVTGRAVDQLGPRLPLSLVNMAIRARPWVQPTLEQSHRYRRVVLESLGATSEPLSGPGTALLLTWLDARNVTAEGAYVDPHLGWLPEALRGQGYHVAFLPRLLGTSGFTDLARRLIGTGERFLFPDLLLDEASLRRCEESAREFSPVIPHGTDVAGVPLARLAREHVDEYRSSHAGNLAYQPLVEELARIGVRPELLVHTFEGHAWEQALAGAVRKHLPGTRVVGFDTLNMTRFALSRFPAAAEVGLRPLPNRIVTNGPLARDTLVAGGMPDRVVAAGCAIRYPHLFEAGGEAPASADERPVALVATDASFDRSVELVTKAIEAFSSDSTWNLQIKCHPLVAAEAIRAALGEPSEVEDIYVDHPFRELLSNADVLLYTYTSTCYEALAAGVPPVFVQAETDLDLDQLEPFAELRWTGRTPAEVRAAAEAALGLKPEERSEWQARAREAVRATLAPVTSACIEVFLT